jgi:hypothetical protein
LATVGCITLGVMLSGTAFSDARSGNHSQSEGGGNAEGATPPDYLDQLIQSQVGPEVTLDEAKESVPFGVLVPDAPVANVDNLTSTFVELGSTVEMDFPQPDAASRDLSLPYVRVLESAWTEGDPLTHFQEAFAALAKYEAQYGREDLPGMSICRVRALPAVCVEPRSPVDVDKRNPAFVEFVVKDVEVQISGGDNLSAVMDAAESMVD